jgi:hypothetical protein
VDAPTRAAALAIAAADARVRFADLPKGAGVGFGHRHRAVEEARAALVFYLSDDDLWFPDHVERMAELLAGHDFVVSLVVGVGSDNVNVKPFDLAGPLARSRLAAGQCFFPMSTAAHRRDAYARLPAGWDAATYRAVWAQFASDPSLALASLPAPTALHMPSSARERMGDDERVRELESLSAMLRDEQRRRRFTEVVLAQVMHHATAMAHKQHRLRLRLDKARAKLAAGR